LFVDVFDHYRLHPNYFVPKQVQPALFKDKQMVFFPLRETQFSELSVKQTRDFYERSLFLL